MLELTKFDDDHQIFIDAESIEIIEQQEDCTVIVTKSGQTHAVKEHASEVYRERESLLTVYEQQGLF